MKGDADMKRLFIEKRMEHFLQFEDPEHALGIQAWIFLHEDDPDNVMSYYRTWMKVSRMLRDNGTQVFLFDPDAQREIEQTEGSMTEEEVFSTFPYDAAYISIDHPMLDGFAVVKMPDSRRVFFFYMLRAEWVAKHPDNERGDSCTIRADSLPWEAMCNLTCYIASANADINLIYKPPVDKRVRANPKKQRSNATVTEVGFRIGAELREYKRSASTQGGRTGTAIRPHLRRAHWHRFWTGPLDGERELVLKWLAPIFVNPGEDDLPPTAHAVPVKR